MKKKLLVFLSLASMSLIACNGKDKKDSSNDDASSVIESSNVESKEEQSSEEKSNEASSNEASASVESSVESIISSEESSSEGRINPDDKTTIFLAGDSTVKTYTDSQYIGGWGQYLDLFLDDNVTVKNCAQGGRSSRSFINEGRLYDTKENNFKYTFSENGGHSIEEDIKEGDYLFIQFGHNDDATKQVGKNISTLPDRMVELGTPDDKGIYPTLAPTEKKPTTYIPEDYLASSDIKQEDKDKKVTEIAKYGDYYYAYGDGTYKWYLNEYIEFAREKGATPVLVTPVARVKFDSSGNIIGGAGLHGDNFAYVQAVRQLAEETDCMLIDLFQDSKIMLETATPSFANFLMALKPNELTGEWPFGYDITYNDASLGYTGIEATHYNKFGAYLEAAKVAEHLKGFINEDKKYNEKEEIKFVNSVLDQPEEYIDPSNNISKVKIEALYDLFSTVNPMDPNYTYKTTEEVDDLILSAIDEYSDINAENLEACGLAIEEIKKALFKINIDDRDKLNNKTDFDDLIANYNEAYKQFAPKAVDTAVIKFTLSAGDITSNQTLTTKTVNGNNFDIKIYATADKNVSVSEVSSAFKYNNNDYTASTRLSLNGAATFGSFRYIEFTSDKKFNITVYCNGGTQDNGSDRELTLVKSNDTSKSYGTFKAPTGNTLTTVDGVEAGTYSLGSTAKGINIYAIIIEFIE